MKWRNPKLAAVLPLSCCILICISIFIAKLPNFESDPYGTLVVSQNIINKGSLTLDTVAPYWTDRFGPHPYQIFKAGAHTYYSYPYGPPIISIPFVFLANIFKIDMIRYERLMQTILCCIVSIGIFLTIYKISNLYFSLPISIMTGLLGFYGTTVGTVAGTGLWNLDYDMLFSGCAVLFAFLHVKNDHRIIIFGVDILPIFIGLALFLSFICRPTSSILIVYIFIFFILYDRPAFLKMAISSAILLALFFILVFIKIPLAMYTADRFSWGNALIALKTFLWSPSRSVLIYNPFIILLPIYGFYFFTRIDIASQIKTFVLLIILSCASLFSLLLFWSYWYGGWCFGPRIFADGIYWSFLATVIVIGEIGVAGARLKNNIPLAIFPVAIIIGFAINIQGIYNSSALAWNGCPSVDTNPCILFDWRFPQFMMTRKKLAEKYIVQGSELGVIPKPEWVESDIDQIIRAAGLYLRAGKDMARLSPVALEKAGLLDASFGAYPIGDKKCNWTRNGYWLRSSGKDTFDIGVEQATSDQVKYLYGIYSKRSQAILFPSPKPFRPETASRFEVGFLRIVFNKQQTGALTYGQAAPSSEARARASRGLLQSATVVLNSGGWVYLSPFGSFNTRNSPWIYHPKLGWLYTSGTSADDIWFYDPQWEGVGGWWWTSQKIFPWVYSNTERTWLYCSASSSAPRAFGRWFGDPVGRWKAR